MQRPRFESTPGKSLAGWLLALNVVALLAAAVALRSYQLDHVPGVNGDEAWMGVQAMRWLQGQPVAWRTPTGNFINLFHFLPMAALHTVLPPSFTLLRLTALASGLLALGLNFVLCRRILGEQLAIVSTAILAVLPLCIAYSRFAWDASQSVLFTLPVVYFCLAAVRRPTRRAWWLCCASVVLLFAIMVHPTNMFLAPLVVVTGAYCWRAKISQIWRVRRALCTAALGAAALAAIALACGVFGGQRVAQAAGRLVSPTQAGEMFRNVLDLISGTTVYRYLAGSQQEPLQAATLAYRMGAALLLAVAACGVYRSLRERRDPALMALLLGWGASLLGFYVVAGPEALRPGYERYGVWIIAPTVLLISEGLAWWMQQSVTSGWRLRAGVAVLLGWCLLAGFQWNYMRMFHVYGGDSHVAFRTAEIEPKLAALRQLTRESIGKQPVHVLAEGWWCYWPLKYLAMAQRNVSVWPVGVDDPNNAGSYEQVPPDEWNCVKFAEAPSLPLTNPGGHVHVRTEPGPVVTLVQDKAGRDLLQIWEPAATRYQSW